MPVISDLPQEMREIIYYKQMSCVNYLGKSKEFNSILFNASKTCLIKTPHFT